MNDKIVNLLLIVLISLLALLFLWVRARAAAGGPGISKAGDDRYSFPALIEYVKRSLHELSRSHANDWGMGEETWNRRVKARAELRKALRGCTYGDAQDKRYVKSFIKDLLAHGYGVGEDNIDRIIPFGDRDRLTVQDRFDIVLYLYKLNFGTDGLSRLIEEYGLDAPKAPKAEEGTFVYEINAEDMDRIFYREYRLLTFREKLDLVVQRIYQAYKGFSVVDELLGQRIDGVSGGVSGIPAHMAAIPAEGGQEAEKDALRRTDEDGEEVSRSWDSVWIFYKGKSVRLSFLSFGSEAELKRVCQNIYKFNLPGQLSEANGYKVNEMKDGSRVVVVRPPFAESWAFFVRKFDVKNAVLEQLIQGENAPLPIELLKFLMKGSRITAITGSQGSGKTTLLMALVKHIYASYTLRVQEMSFELNLRRIYTGRNILSFRETDYVSGQAGLDLQKKTDGTVNILGEVATDEVAAWMVQMAQVASLFTLFTHHAKTFRDLMESLRNSLLKTGVFRDERVAELQVASAIDFDVHLRRDMSGKRYIERITECCRPDEKEAGEPGANDETGGGLVYGAMPYRRGYSERVIVEYRDGCYVAVQPISKRCREAMIREMTPEDAASFGRFAKAYWGEKIGA
ncbi:MAG: ATPase, T2SS/T4P/T4SS family [Paenibacillus macerans]|uniref:Type II/IV secretion system family protein n=1 Tax=Paenibacillus macerans TaxID=44252 RepID=A0A090ZBU4_PAEMA|nr:ATPase, T2SS/T4P/T4SS family [Paenibacillus macerans]KFN08764.1 type II/IV secretion system family protein [Paenibacillus macerans]MCY7562158.1 Flp pilus assembly complex ATPase component TadA [Paenibacillus macerans]MDU7474333.1 ATPase, T2SS/T4P/T4SS family [Paenibacillus macerans]MEC0140506.1 ATPase, T2SS/T4P/T4SS family [Paenibacillus macerans]MEC0153788.1 ATPase, T2SS/T4P/T4SS family [Paenibacillus macerans]